MKTKRIRFESTIAPTVMPARGLYLSPAFMFTFSCLFRPFSSVVFCFIVTSAARRIPSWLAVLETPMDGASLSKGCLAQPLSPGETPQQTDKKIVRHQSSFVRNSVKCSLH